MQALVILNNLNQGLITLMQALISLSNAELTLIYDIISSSIA